MQHCLCVEETTHELYLKHYAHNISSYLQYSKLTTQTLYVTTHKCTKRVEKKISRTVDIETMMTGERLNMGKVAGIPKTRKTQYLSDPTCQKCQKSPKLPKWKEFQNNPAAFISE